MQESKKMASGCGRKTNTKTCGCKGKPSKEKIMRIEYGWDKHIRSWNLVVIDENDDIIISEYVGDMISINYLIDYYTSKHNICNVMLACVVVN